MDNTQQKFVPGEQVEVWDPDFDNWLPATVKDVYERGHFPFDPRPGGYAGREASDGQFYTVVPGENTVYGRVPCDVGEADLRRVR